VMDLNADLAEGFGAWPLTDDDALLEVVTSANVACGFHAGDAPTMRRVCARAAERGVRIGAQVSYRDLAGFGRRFLDVDRLKQMFPGKLAIGPNKLRLRRQGEGWRQDLLNLVDGLAELYSASATIATGA